jgi:hypothetical protein
MLEGGDAAGYGRQDARLQLVLREVRDECSFGDSADGMGYGCCS